MVRKTLDPDVRVLGECYWEDCTADSALVVYTFDEMDGGVSEGQFLCVQHTGRLLHDLILLLSTDEAGVHHVTVSRY